MGEMMKRMLIMSLFLVLMLFASCQNGDKGRVAQDGYTIEEVLDSLPLVTVSGKEVAIVDLKNYDVLGSYPLTAGDVLATFLSPQSLFVVSENMVYRINIEDGEKKKTKLAFSAQGACALQYKVIIWSEDAIYEFNKNEKVEKISDCDGNIVQVQPFPGYTSIIAVLEKEGTFELAKYSLVSKELERKEPLGDFVKLRISPFGKRIYVLEENRLLFLDAKNLRFISEIPFEGQGVDFIVTASENKVFVFTRDPAKILSIKRTILKVESEIQLSFPPSLKTITGDGGTIYFLAADSLFRFDTGSNGIVKTAPKKANQVDMLLTTPKGLRVVLFKKGTHGVELLDGNTLLLEKEIGVEGELLSVICGVEPFRILKEEPAADTLAGDTSSTAPLPPAHMKTYYTLQVSSSSILEGARKLMRELKGKSLPVFIDSAGVDGGEKVYRVKVGAFEARGDAEKFSRGLESTYGMESWISQQELSPFYMSEAGIDINGDKDGELLLYEKGTLSLFSNRKGVQKPVFTKKIEGITLDGTPFELHDDNVVLLAVSFRPDSVVAVRWFDNKYELVKRKDSRQ